MLLVHAGVSRAESPEALPELHTSELGRVGGSLPRRKQARQQEVPESPGRVSAAWFPCEALALGSLWWWGSLSLGYILIYSE